MPSLSGGVGLLLVPVLWVLCCAVRVQPPAEDLPPDLPVDLPSDLAADLTDDPTRPRSAIREVLIRDCSDLPYGSASGVYLVTPDLLTPSPVYCDMEDGEGWTVFQHRANIVSLQDFFLDWEAYKWGLGTLDGQYWWGLEHLFRLTSQLDRVYELRVDLWDFDSQTRYATYQDFNIDSEADGYRLSIADYEGNAGDSLTYHNGMMFTTKDRDNDNRGTNCAEEFQGAWWYDDCYDSNLNGVYLAEDHTGVTWGTWRGVSYSLNATTMKIRPTKKL